jgi:hypothetical protein
MEALLMPWIISGGTGAITLPFAPSKTRITCPAKIDQFTQEGELPIVIVDGAENFTVQLDGVIYDPAKTASQIWSDVVVKLLQKRGSEVQLITSDGDLDGNYVMASFEPVRDRKIARWTYTMRLVMGKAYVIL